MDDGSKFNANMILDLLAGRETFPLAKAEMRRRNRNRRKAGKPPHRLSWEQEMEMERVLRAARDGAFL